MTKKEKNVDFSLKGDDDDAASEDPRLPPCGRGLERSGRNTEVETVEGRGYEPPGPRSCLTEETFQNLAARETL